MWINLNYSQKQRLAYIDFKLLFVGRVTRNEIVTKFEKGMSGATADLNLYKELCPNNMSYDNKQRMYIQTDKFKPLFTHDPRKTLVKLANQITDGYDAIGDVAFPVEAPSQLNIPDIFIVARLIQAIINQKPVSIIYTSLSSGSAARELVPHSIVDNGLRWHVRAFDRKSNSFRDFVLTRISKATILPQKLDSYEDKLEDHQWMRMMPLQLIPHPNNVQHPTAIELDYGMENKVLELNVRAALAGYLLRRWNVDCTKEASLEGGEYQLWLRNRQTLYGAENLAIAPGYKPDERGAINDTSSKYAKP
ncbi:WYL domain-containing protein [Cognaticolwellia beringensis]|uniref:WYL domain-containing protein n=1 Tax=Cognaticolwellia beringensis TaxID=1967665 RepID=A0A222G3F9_9GAMM|nr:WYL domain-containing protein [Cognaticolwellia beringensis]ASP46301.1 WYL domain-containing protein [Cognaticolwellia beringensis]